MEDGGGGLGSGCGGADDCNVCSLAAGVLIVLPGGC